MSTNFKNIQIEKEDPGIWIVKIARPKALNALNSETLLELKEALNQARLDKGLRVLIFTGEGEKAFIAGADISEMKDKTSSEGVAFARVGHEVTKQLELLSVPTIAAVNGFALGGGTEFAISCDFILASESAVFGQPEVCLGIIPGFGGTVRLARFAGFPMAKELIYTGRKISAEEALRIGLANQVFKKNEFREKVIGVAREIALNSKSAVVTAKKLLVEFSEMNGLDSKMDAEAQEFGELFGSPDQREGMGAFVEKRKPKFEGIEL